MNKQFFNKCILEANFKFKSFLIYVIIYFKI
jgi:hypothetical protein